MFTVLASCHKGFTTADKRQSCASRHRAREISVNFGLSENQYLRLSLCGSQSDKIRFTSESLASSVLTGASRRVDRQGTEIGVVASRNFNIDCPAPLSTI
ncbi:predicted protein [Coccidioides posadasii str. Silveira]|uniref:Predicted protein n=1 Tax=Coccidioides posadasii (strain RMSCC 757 / Silveira) TaxID=443226 RepID=E9D6X3_COCPS|nr:predicted protein [Coccidioides posadasii str. Silveira]